ncbi:MAG: FAD-binding oxidoreductase [Proteobacteria bacterium]|nr:FAD-binding oxidoreductase [Pseudomonadota bacterium]MCP4916681.1 FAD-binding oxidoreductase [Pseudomonadota bacterium]
MSTPDSADVVVVGASVAGLYCARDLARDGVRVVLVEAAPEVRSANPGFALVGTAESPERLVEGLGLERAGALTAFSRRSVRMLPSEGTVLRATLQGSELEHEATLAASEALGIASVTWTAEPAQGLLGTARFGLSRVLVDDRLVDVVALKRRLVAEAVESGAVVAHRCRVERLDEADGVLLHTRTGAISCELAVLACGHTARALVPWLGDKLWPVRCQSRAVETRWPWTGLGVVAQEGHLWWRGSGGRVLHGGARWATPHLEVGETEPTPVAAVTSRLETVLGQVFPPLVGRAAGEGARIESFSCDQLPLVGAPPGGGRVLVLVGFGEHELAWGAAAGAELAAGILGGVADVPSLLRAGRFVS